MSTARSTLRQATVALRAMLVFTVVLGVGYTLLITGVGQLAFPWQANGSLVTDARGQVVGSALIGQSFTRQETGKDAAGVPLAQYFQSRPSAAGTGYDGTASSGSNLGPENKDFVAAIQHRIDGIVAFEHVDPSAIPPDAVTASGSGLDPDISPAYALLQIPRIAAARGLPQQTVRSLVESNIQARDLGFLGEPRVNVLKLNLGLDALRG